MDTEVSEYSQTQKPTAKISLPLLVNVSIVYILLLADTNTVLELAPEYKPVLLLPLTLSIVVSWTNNRGRSQHSLGRLI